jgi:hypothetical protein
MMAFIYLVVFLVSSEGFLKKDFTKLCMAEGHSAQPLRKVLISDSNEKPSHAAQVLGDIPEDQ